MREGYLDHLLELKGVTRDEADEIAERRHELLERELSQATSESYTVPSEPRRGVWAGYLGGLEKDVEEVDTTVDRDQVVELLDVQTQFPQDFHAHPKIETGMRARRQMARGECDLDRARQAFARLLPVRSTGSSR